MPKSASLIWSSVDQQVGRLEIAMDDAAVVRMLQGLGDGDADAGDFAPIEAAAGRQLVLQAAAINELHDVVQIAVLLSIAVKLDNVGMQEPLERFDFLLEGLAKVVVIAEVARQDLDRGPLTSLVVQPTYTAPMPPRPRRRSSL